MTWLSRIDDWRRSRPAGVALALGLGRAFSIGPAFARTGADAVLGAVTAPERPTTVGVD